MNTLNEIYNYRQMVFSLVKRDLRGRYKGSVLGFLWTFINPLLQLIVYTVVFSVIMRAGIERYYLFLFVTLVPWIFFATCLTGGAGCIREQENLVKKIYFPREVLPIAFVTSQFINMLFSFVIIFAVLIVTGVGGNLNAMLYLPIIMLIEYFLALGLTFLTSSLTVYFRDLQYILGIVGMAWMYLSPIMYSIDMVPNEFKFIFTFNPISPIMIAYRDILYFKQPPHLNTLLGGVIIGIFTLLLGIISFSKLKKNFAEEL